MLAVCNNIRWNFDFEWRRSIKWNICILWKKILSLSTKIKDSLWISKLNSNWFNFLIKIISISWSVWMKTFTNFYWTRSRCFWYDAGNVVHLTLDISYGTSTRNFFGEEQSFVLYISQDETFWKIYKCIPLSWEFERRIT